MNQKILCSSDDDALTVSSIPGAGLSYLDLAETGNGKSYLLNYLLNTHYASGTKARITDTGKSGKTCKDLLAAISTGQKPVNPFNTLVAASAQQEPASSMTEKS